MKSPIGEVIVPVSGMNERAGSSSAHDQLVSPLLPSKNEKPEAPETNITFLAISFAVYENAASWCGKLAFIWATVVVLGGFAVTLETVDFWFVTILLVIEGVRIFCRSNEVISLRSWATSLHICLQVLSALASIVLSSYRLSIGFDGGGSDIMNRNRALRVFYCLCEMDAILVLIEKLCWIDILLGEWGLSLLNMNVNEFSKMVALPEDMKSIIAVFSKVDEEYSLHDLRSVARRFYYATYSRCINGSIFEGLKMEFVSYNMELLQSVLSDEQLMGAGVLLVLARNDRSAVKTLDAIGRRQDVVEKLIEMLNWENLQEQKIRKRAAEIISILVKQNQNRMRVMAIAGYMESIASLLYDSNQTEIHSRRYSIESSDIESSDNYTYPDFSLLGLQILENLANDYDNCTKIARNKALLPKIIGLTELKPKASKFLPINTAMLALQLMGRLALKKRISEMVFAIRKLTEVCQYGDFSRKILAIDRLTSLSLKQEGCEIIGGSGGVLRNLLSLFFMEGINNNDETKELVSKAGKALALLSHENKHNCQIMMSIKPNLNASLISVLHDPLQAIQAIQAARILRNLWMHADADDVGSREITVPTGTHVEEVVALVRKTQGPHQEAAIGLAAPMFRILISIARCQLLTSLHEKEIIIQKRKVWDEFKDWWTSINGKISLISELVEVFRRYPRPSKEAPSIRRFSVELLIAVMEMDRALMEMGGAVKEKDRSSALEMRSELEEALDRVMETTSEMENYSTFSGSVGLSRHCLPIQSLVQSAMELIRN